MNFRDIMESKAKEPSDINEHLHTLYNISLGSDVIVELGVRGLISTFAFLAAKPKKLYSIDICRPEEWGCTNFSEIEKAAKDQLDFNFIQHASETVKIPEETIDILFVDTIHTATQVRKELNSFGDKVTKYIIFHDTTLYGVNGYGVNGFEPNNGILPAIEEFLEKMPFSIYKEYTNNNGLMIIKNDNFKV